MKLRRNKFDLSHEVKLTCDMGAIIPINCVEVIPGDKFSGYNQALIRLSAQIAPVMHNVNVYTRTFYVPNRLLWKNWDDFITGGKDGSSTHVKPYINVAPVKGSLEDYFGLPPISTREGHGDHYKVDALPFRAYNKIINDHFIDQQICTPLVENMEDGEDTLANYSLHNVLWEKDYFTSARPSPQAGTGVTMPIGGSAPLTPNWAPIQNGQDGVDITIPARDLQVHTLVNDITRLNAWNSSSSSYVNGRISGSFVGGDFTKLENLHFDDLHSADVAYNTHLEAKQTAQTTTGNIKSDVEVDLSNVKADLTNAEAVPIETLRNAFKIQSYLEKLNRAGHHMTDWLRSFFGVRASDARLQMSEYIGGSKMPIMFSEVLQTSSTTVQDTPLGYSAGHSASVMNTKMWKKYCEEHGFLITVMYILPRTQYAQGVSRMWTRESKYDYYLPEFANLGEQAIKNKELYVQANNDDEGVFGYQTRFQEMRSLESRVCGDFRDQMKYWSMYRDFEALPLLNEDFVTSNPTKRIYATEGMTHHCIVNVANYLYAVRSIPRYVTPATL